MSQREKRAQRKAARMDEAGETTKWSSGLDSGGHRVLYLQFNPPPTSGAVWVEVTRGSSVAYIIRKYRDTSEGNERLARLLTTNVTATVNSPRGALAVELGMPGAGYAMEIAERLMPKRRRTHRA